MGDLNARTGTSAEFNNFDLSRTTADYYGIGAETRNSFSHRRPL